MPLSDGFLIDSFKPASKIESHFQSEVNFLLLYTQKERKLSESGIAKIVRGVRFILSFKTVMWYYLQNEFSDYSYHLRMASAAFLECPCFFNISRIHRLFTTFPNKYESIYSFIIHISSIDIFESLSNRFSTIL